MYYKDEKPICKVGDIFYRVIKGDIVEVTITKVQKMELGHYVYRDNTGKTFFSRQFGNYIFKTIEEAEKYINRKEALSTKKEMLKSYENQVNKILGLEHHYFIK